MKCLMMSSLDMPSFNISSILACSSLLRPAFKALKTSSVLAFGSFNKFCILSLMSSRLFFLISSSVGTSPSRPPPMKRLMISSIVIPRFSISSTLALSASLRDDLRALNISSVLAFWSSRSACSLFFNSFFSASRWKCSRTCSIDIPLFNIASISSRVLSPNCVFIKSRKSFSLKFCPAMISFNIRIFSDALTSPFLSFSVSSLYSLNFLAILSFTGT